MFHYDERWKEYILSVDDDVNEKIGRIYEKIYWELRFFVEKSEVDEELFKEAFKHFLNFVEIAGLKKAEDIMFQMKTLASYYGTGAVEVAIQREQHLRERIAKRGGRPSVVSKYCKEIDSIYEGYMDNPLLSKRDNIEKRIEEIKELLREVKEKHSKKTYLKVRKYAMEKIEDLKWELSHMDIKTLLHKITLSPNS